MTTVTHSSNEMAPILPGSSQPHAPFSPLAFRATLRAGTIFMYRSSDSNSCVSTVQCLPQGSRCLPRWCLACSICICFVFFSPQCYDLSLVSVGHVVTHRPSRNFISFMDHDFPRTYTYARRLGLLPKRNGGDSRRFNEIKRRKRPHKHNMTDEIVCPREE